MGQPMMWEWIETGYCDENQYTGYRKVTSANMVMKEAHSIKDEISSQFSACPDVDRGSQFSKLTTFFLNSSSVKSKSGFGISIFISSTVPPGPMMN